jgi:hypothetical protein
MARRSRNKPRLWPKVLMIALVCLVAGAAYAWVRGGEMAHGPDLPRASFMTGPAGDAVPATGQMPRADLEREVARLREELRKKDQQIFDLTIQLKLQTAGSHAPR